MVVRGESAKQGLVFFHKQVYFDFMVCETNYGEGTLYA